MSTILHLLRGQMSSPVNHLGADVLIYHFSQEGRCPRGEMSFLNIQKRDMVTHLTLCKHNNDDRVIYIPYTPLLSSKT